MSKYLITNYLCQIRVAIIYDDLLIACFSLVFAVQKLTTWSKKSLLVIFLTKLSTLNARSFRSNPEF